MAENDDGVGSEMDRLAEHREVLEVLHALGFQPSVVDWPRPPINHGAGGPIALDAVSTAHVVLEAARSGIIGALAWEACVATVQWFRDQHRAVTTPVDVTRQRAAQLARWRLWVEFEVELITRQPVREAEEPDGGWTITFELDGHRYWATIPPDVDRLKAPGAVRVGRRVED